MRTPAVPALSVPHTTPGPSRSHDADTDSGWGCSTSLGWGLASNHGWVDPSPRHGNKAIRASKQREFPKQSGSSILSSRPTDLSVSTGELVTEGAAAFWKPPPLHRCPEPEGTSKKGKKAMQVWTHYESLTKLRLVLQTGYCQKIQCDRTIVLFFPRTVIVSECLSDLHQVLLILLTFLTVGVKK